MKYAYLKWTMFLVSSISICLLPGCANQQPPKVVNVPIAIPCPSPALPKPPQLPIAQLKSNSPPDVVIKAYAQSVEILQAYTAQLRTLMSSYQR